MSNVDIDVGVDTDFNPLTEKKSRRGAKPGSMCMLRPRFDKNSKLEAGVDEVARGCLFGPVYAAAVILNPEVTLHPWLNDSKRTTRKRRAIVRQWVEENAIAWAVASVDNKTVDIINIRNAAMEAMNMAIGLLKVRPQLVLVDGNYFAPTEINKDIPHATIVGGDATYASIAAASVLAKEHHDEYIRSLLKDHPDWDDLYDLSNNVGYGAPKHIHGIKEVGTTEFHRQSFLHKILAKPLNPLFLLKDDSDEGDENESDGDDRTSN